MDLNRVSEVRVISYVAGSDYIVPLTAVLGIRNLRIRMFLGLPDPHPNPLVTSRVRIRDEHFGSHYREIREKKIWVKILKLFDAHADPDPGIFLTLDPGSRSGKTSRIRNTADRIIPYP